MMNYEYWRRFAPGNPDRIGGTKWDRELAAFASLYGWAVKNGHVTRNPVATKQVRGRNGEVVTAPAARAKDARPSNVHWLTPRTSRDQSPTSWPPPPHPVSPAPRSPSLAPASC